MKNQKVIMIGLVLAALVNGKGYASGIVVRATPLHGRLTDTELVTLDLENGGRIVRYHAQKDGGNVLLQLDNLVAEERIARISRHLGGGLYPDITALISGGQVLGDRGCMKHELYVKLDVIPTHLTGYERGTWESKADKTVLTLEKELVPTLSGDILVTLDRMTEENGIRTTAAGTFYYLSLAMAKQIDDFKLGLPTVLAGI
jgi:hypothetical protein